MDCQLTLNVPFSYTTSCPQDFEKKAEKVKLLAIKYIDRREAKESARLAAYKFGLISIPLVLSGGSISQMTFLAILIILSSHYRMGRWPVNYFHAANLIHNYLGKFPHADEFQVFDYLDWNWESKF
ncbi:MAG: hypothetical protein LW832_05740 [Parachlamydia sp.]|jgi:hypothetical protein|nr:hypothetical protein [Parachlamydia sp.]